MLPVEPANRGWLMAKKSRKKSARAAKKRAAKKPKRHKTVKKKPASFSDRVFRAYRAIVGG
jgi:hypothetical protein